MIAIMLPGISRLFEGARILSLERGETVFRAGDPVAEMYLVLKGRIGLSRPLETGMVAVLQRAGPGQVLAEASAYSGCYHCDAHAQGPAVAQVLARSRFLDRLRRDGHLAEAWAAYLARAVQGARMRAEIRGLKTVAARLDAWLGEVGALPARGQWLVLADELGVSREALYRELARRRQAAR